MKVYKGFYRSSTQGDLPAIGIKINSKTFAGVADFSGTSYMFYSVSEFIEIDEMEIVKKDSIIFPKVTDFFKDGITSMKIDINFTETK